ncbi:actin cortical patch SUR7/pH-response regulator pali, partial [Tricharina praecox]|uniref:actin cortical patch SUR7/pH-response regulator pali n=1 Tax=Tricharina praecox TaxID=43433 RepID=UPI00222012E6
SLILLSGATVLLFLLLLAGAFDRRPLNRIFFLQADTTGIPNAPNGITHWTLYNHCSSHNGINTACGPNSAAYPIDPVRNFGTRTGIPSSFVHHPSKYFYLSRFLYAFYIITLFFTLCALALSLAACLSPLATYLATACALAATLSAAFCAAVMTAVYEMAARAWRHDGRQARIGVKATAFTW